MAQEDRSYGERLSKRRRVRCLTGETPYYHDYIRGRS
jgi:hypothetical protein